MQKCSTTIAIVQQRQTKSSNGFRMTNALVSM